MGDKHPTFLKEYAVPLFLEIDSERDIDRDRQRQRQRDRFYLPNKF